MSTSPSLWHRWKSLKLPWRKRRLAGTDLNGTTFYETLQNPISATLPRRTAVYPRHTHPSDVHLSPAWIQWLRHTRPIAPTMQEQLAEVGRRERMVLLASEADARWKSRPSLLDSPERTGQGVPEILAPRDTGEYVDVKKEGELERLMEEKKNGDVVRDAHADGKANPWKRERGGPSEGWQPQAWTPGKAERRR